LKAEKEELIDVKQIKNPRAVKKTGKPAFPFFCEHTTNEELKPAAILTPTLHL
jgi:hypothetical protein